MILKCGGNGDGVRHDESDDESALVADDHGVCYVRTRLQSVRDGLRGDEFSSGGLDEIFFAVGDEEVVVGVEIADVAGVKPAFFVDCFARGVRTFVITLHPARTLGQNFAVPRNTNPNLGDGASVPAAAILPL